ncbi:MAG: UDP-N-acetylmuramate dehydrogenase [Cellulosilyticaceae bacterium]
METTKIMALLSAMIPKANIKENEPMKSHTSFKIGGVADVFVSPTTKLQLVDAIRICKENQVPYYIIGNGSNLLVSDKGFRGVIIEVSKNLSEMRREGNMIIAEAGALLARIAKTAESADLTGFEFAHGIPGTLGGAVTMNAGAYDGEMKNVILQAEIIDQQGQIQTFTKDQLELGYRTSIIQKKGYIVLEAVIALQPGNKEEITAKMKDLAGRRKDKQPLEYPSAGSTFKRPVGHFAGKLIMDSDLSGYEVGGAQVSEKHCGFVINKGDATFEDVMQLIEHVQKVVKERFNVELEAEVRIIGER